MVRVACSDHSPTQPPWLLLIISFLGFLLLLNHSISLCKWLFCTFLRSEKNLITSYGSWALVTGATDGIGKAFAYQLARRGLNLVLVSRSFEKLRTVSDEIQAEFPNTHIRIVQMDFSGDLSGGVRQLKEAVEDLDLGVLINNVGMTYPEARFFHEVEEEVWMKIVRVNLEGTTAITKAVISGMIRRRRGAIVNIGSGAGIVVPSHPLYTIYAATKAYVNQLSRSLYVEYKDRGIHVQCQVPLYVATKMVRKIASIEGPCLWIPSAEDYAEAAIGRIGYEPQCTPYWAHSLQWCFTGFVPNSLLDAWRFSIGIRRRQNPTPCSST